jgi:hypothetical protein
MLEKIKYLVMSKGTLVTMMSVMVTSTLVVGSFADDAEDMLSSMGEVFNSLGIIIAIIGVAIFLWGLNSAWNLKKQEQPGALNALVMYTVIAGLVVFVAPGLVGKVLKIFMTETSSLGTSISGN